MDSSASSGFQIALPPRQVTVLSLVPFLTLVAASVTKICHEDN